MYQIRFGEVLPMNEHQRKVKEMIFQVVECEEKMSRSVIDLFIHVVHLGFSSFSLK
jgi:hypothetical protein